MLCEKTNCCNNNNSITKPEKFFVDEHISKTKKNVAILVNFYKIL